jgi:hypothetical protein
MGDALITSNSVDTTITGGANGGVRQVNGGFASPLTGQHAGAVITGGGDDIALQVTGGTIILGINNHAGSVTGININETILDCSGLDLPLFCSAIN